MAVVEPKVRCGEKSWTLTEWQALGFDAGTTTVRLPNTIVWAEDTIKMIMARARATLLLHG